MRLQLCGAISGYNDGPKPIRNLMNVVAKSLSINGFIVNRLRTNYEDEFYRTVPAQIAAGKLKYNPLPRWHILILMSCLRYQEHKYQGLESAGQALLDVQTGKNTGKAIIVVADH
jgi:NADPH-dependent curcumin reductase CurA